MPINFQSETNVDLIRAYGDLLKEMKVRKIIRSGNLVGDLGEYLAMDCYNKTPGLATLGPAPPGCKSFDAVGINGKRYSIKSTSGAVTGSFFGLLPPTALNQDDPIFDFLVIVQFDSDYGLKRIIELSWSQFVRYKRWLPRQSAFNIAVTRTVVAAATTIFPTSTSVL